MINSSYYIKDYISQLTMLNRGNCKIEKIEISENFEMSDVYSANKHGILVKDIIQVRGS